MTGKLGKHGNEATSISIENIEGTVLENIVSIILYAFLIVIVTRVIGAPTLTILSVFVPMWILVGAVYVSIGRRDVHILRGILEELKND